MTDFASGFGTSVMQVRAPHEARFSPSTKALHCTMPQLGNQCMSKEPATCNTAGNDFDLLSQVIHPSRFMMFAHYRVIIKQTIHAVVFCYPLYLRARWVRFSLSMTSEDSTRGSRTRDTMHARRTPYRLGQLPRSINYQHGQPGKVL